MGTDLRDVSGRFAIRGHFLVGTAWGEGRIHGSFVSEWQEDGGVVRYLHQRLNEHVLPDVDRVMDNIGRALDHLRAKPGPLRTLELVPTREGRRYLRDDQGVAWRTWRFVEGALSYRTVQSLDHARTAATAFGRFLAGLADLPGPPLPETIRGFHDTPGHLARLAAADQADALGRAAGARAEIDLAGELSAVAPVVVRGLTSGALPTRTCHHDTKLDNVLIDDDTGAAAAVVDLDTIMPGSAVTDFGDLVRSATKPDANLDVFRAVTEGYLRGTGDLLVPAEIDLLPVAGRLIALELGVRFLTDHLTGDRYFGAEEPGGNLLRARIQLEQAAALASAEPAMREIVRSIRG